MRSKWVLATIIAGMGLTFSGCGAMMSHESHEMEDTSGPLMVVPAEEMEDDKAEQDQMGMDSMESADDMMKEGDHDMESDDMMDKDETMDEMEEEMEDDMEKDSE